MYIIRKDKYSYDYQGHRKKYISQKFVDACVKISTIPLRIMYTFWWPKIVKTECKGFSFFPMDKKFHIEIGNINNYGI